MAEPNVLEQLAALNATLQTIPVGSEDGDHSVEELEEVKRGLDDARLGLWARLQGAHADDVVAFEERFRVRRALELCSRLTTDLRIGVMNPTHPEFADLWIASVELSQAIQAARAGAESPEG
jgi:hypothetical protein